MAIQKTAELTGTPLDWAVAKCEGYADDEISDEWNYSSEWSQGGPIIEREAIQITPYGAASSQPKGVEYWCASIHLESEVVEHYGEPLEAAMRSYVASKLGGEIEVPDELLS